MEKMLPLLTVSSPRNGKREVGGKSYFPLHGKAYFAGQVFTCCQSNDPKVYKNIMLVSKKSYRGGWDGTGSKPFIGEVISVHFTGTQAELAETEAKLYKEHGLKK